MSHPCQSICMTRHTPCLLQLHVRTAAWQALSIPMWRRSLGGRAHPLAPALSAALQRLTGLTNLAVDGKFSHLGVVSGLTNLRQLASAAPLSKEGWQVRVGVQDTYLGAYMGVVDTSQR